MNLDDFFFEETYYLNGTLPIQVEFGVENGEVERCYINDVYVDVSQGIIYRLDDLTKIGEYVRTPLKPLGEWQDLETILISWARIFYDKWQEEINATLGLKGEEV